MPIFVDWIILCILVTLSISAAIQGRRKKANISNHKIRFYLSDIGFSIAVVALLFALKPSNFSPLAFYASDKGIFVSDELMIIFFTTFTTPFFLAFTPWSNLYPKDIAAAKELFGFPTALLPNNRNEYVFFFFFILVGVLFEELFARLLMFHALNATFHLQGDALVVVAALFFAVGHWYQGLRGVLSNLIVGLVLGKIFLIKEDLIYPIALHMGLNLTIVVLAFRRWRAMT
jgi:membrane protease YdiL (CAAX protease family)